MRIEEIYVTQRKLRYPDKLLLMIEDIKLLPPIILGQLEDGTIEVREGHHRLVAFWLAGRKTLSVEEYILVQIDKSRPRFGKVEDLWKRTMGKSW